VSQKTIQHDENVVAVLTGHLLKDPDYVTKYHLGQLRAEGEHIQGRFTNRPVQVKADVRSILSVLD
jgi:threonine synthase